MKLSQLIVSKLNNCSMSHIHIEMLISTKEFVKIHHFSFGHYGWRLNGTTQEIIDLSKQCGFIWLSVGNRYISYYITTLQ